jgi:propanol-preferring alcohol dehydrogenase
VAHDPLSAGTWADHRAFAPCISAGGKYDAQTRHLCLVRIPPGEFPTPLFDVVANCITIRGSFVGTSGDLAEALGFAAEGKVKADIELHPLSAINEVLTRLQKGNVASRPVIDFSGAA